MELKGDTASKINKEMEWVFKVVIQVFNRKFNKMIKVKCLVYNNLHNSFQLWNTMKQNKISRFYTKCPKFSIVASIKNHSTYW